MGPIWDTDRSMGSDQDGRSDEPEQWHFHPGKYFEEAWWRDLFRDPNFRQRWTDRWFELRESVFSTDNINRIIDQQSDELREAQTRNFERWPRFAPAKHKNPRFEFSDPELEGWEAELSHLKNWMARRVQWVDGQLSNPPP